VARHCRADATALRARHTIGPVARGASAGIDVAKRARMRVRAGRRDYATPLLSVAVLVFELLLRWSIYGGQPLKPISGDEQDYLDLAAQIRATGDPFDQGRLPGYPLFLLLNALVTGAPDLRAVRSAHHLLAALSAMLFFRVLSRVTGQRWLPFVLSLFTFANLNWIPYEWYTLTETLSLFLCTALLATMFSFVERPGRGVIVALFGEALALLLVKPTYVFLPGLVAVACWVRGRRSPSLDRRKLRTTVMLCLTFSLALTLIFPVVNWRRHHFFNLTCIGNTGLFLNVIERGYYRDAQFAADPVTQAVLAVNGQNQIGVSFGAFHEAFSARYPRLLDDGYSVLGAWATRVLRARLGRWLVDDLRLTAAGLSGSERWRPFVLDAMRDGWGLSLARALTDWHHFFCERWAYLFFPACALCLAAYREWIVAFAFGAALALYTVGFSISMNQFDNCRFKLPVEPFMYLALAAALLAVVSRLKMAVGYNRGP
jgi:hypothetical protein